MIYNKLICCFTRSRENVNPTDVAIALYRQGVPLEKASEQVGRSKQSVGYALNDYLRWKYPFTDYLAAYSCEVRQLMAGSNMTIYEAAYYLGSSAQHLRQMIGAFDSRKPRDFHVSLSQHALATYLKDGALFNHKRIAETIGLSEDEVAELLDDDRKQYEYDRWSCYLRQEETGLVETKRMAEACGLDSRLVERASSLGLIDGDETHGGYRVDAIDTLRIMGLFDRYSLAWINEGEQNEQENL